MLPRASPAHLLAYRAGPGRAGNGCFWADPRGIRSTSLPFFSRAPDSRVAAPTPCPTSAALRHRSVTADASIARPTDPTPRLRTPPPLTSCRQSPFLFFLVGTSRSCCLHLETGEWRLKSRRRRYHASLAPLLLLHVRQGRASPPSRPASSTLDLCCTPRLSVSSGPALPAAQIGCSPAITALRRTPTLSLSHVSLLSAARTAESSRRGPTCNASHRRCYAADVL